MARVTAATSRKVEIYLMSDAVANRLAFGDK
jgi:hypothetical protein